jgi:hypothetical protein
MADVRKKPRRRTLKSGAIILGSRARVTCAIRNLSEAGARLEVAGTFAVPSAFQLAISGLPPRICKVIWRTDKHIGVEFQAPTT